MLRKCERFKKHIVQLCLRVLSLTVQGHVSRATGQYMDTHIATTIHSMLKFHRVNCTVSQSSCWLNEHKLPFHSLRKVVCRSIRESQCQQGYWRNNAAYGKFGGEGDYVEEGISLQKPQDSYGWILSSLMNFKASLLAWGFAPLHWGKNSS